MRTLFTTFVLLLAAWPLSAQDARLLKHFEYDRDEALEVHEMGIEMRGDVAVHDISYISPKGGRVPAYVVVPSGRGPFAAIVWGHWYMPGSEFRNRKEFLAEAVALAPSGVISILPDGPIARPGHVEDTTPLNEQQVTDRVQAIIDMRRAVDLLFTRPNVDRTRLAYVGHSYNAEVGAFLTGIDRRFKCFVLMAGSMSDKITVKTEELQKYRREVGPKKFDSFMNKYDWLDQGEYVSHASPAYVFLQYASRETFLTPERAREYASVVSEPKRFKLYDAPHALNAEARRDRIAFLTEQLQLKPLSPEAIAAIPDLVQPPENSKQ